MINKIARYCMFFMTFAVLHTMHSCSDFDEMNRDPNQMDQVNPGMLLNPVLYNMAIYNWKRSEGYTLELMQAVVPTNSTGGVSRYFISETAGDGTWTTYYRWLMNIRQMEKMATGLNEVNYQAVAKTLHAWVFQLATDCFGDVPYTEACRGDEQLFNPKFDKQRYIYATLIEELGVANKLFDESAGLKYNTDGDLLYNTSALLVSNKSEGILKWRKFCNSLRLRLLVRSMEAMSGNAEIIRTMLDNPVEYPMFESNDDAALLSLTGVFPQEPPMARPQDLTSYRAMASFFIDPLNAWNDPRLPVFSTTVKDPETNQNIYLGWESGYEIAPSYSASNINQNLAKAPMKIVLMSYAEVEFIKAELALKGIVAGLAAGESYRKGTEAAIAQWGLDVPEDYFERPGVTFDGSMEQIMLQKYYALFFCDYQAWFEYNRTGLPAIPRGSGVPAGNEMPRRFKYPATVQRTNMANYKEAVASMGGDNFSIRLFWQR